jgi:hypothetical protein
MTSGCQQKPSESPPKRADQNVLTAAEYERAPDRKFRLGCLHLTFPNSWFWLKPGYGSESTATSFDTSNFRPSPAFSDKPDVIYRVEGREIYFAPPVPQGGKVKIFTDEVSPAFPVLVIHIRAYRDAPRCDIKSPPWQDGNTPLPEYGAVSDPRTQLTYSVRHVIAGIGEVEYQWSPRSVPSSRVEELDAYIKQILIRITAAGE